MLNIIIIFRYMIVKMMMIITKVLTVAGCDGRHARLQGGTSVAKGERAADGRRRRRLRGARGVSRPQIWRARCGRHRSGGNLHAWLDVQDQTRVGQVCSTQSAISAFGL